MTQVDLFVPTTGSISYLCHPFHTACSTGSSTLAFLGTGNPDVFRHPAFVSIRRGGPDHLPWNGELCMSMLKRITKFAAIYGINHSVHTHKKS